MKKFRRKKNKGIVFWITGLSGSGKTRIGKKIKKNIIENYGPTILFSGDNTDVLARLLAGFGDELDDIKSFINQIPDVKKIEY